VHDEHVINNSIKDKSKKNDLIFTKAFAKIAKKKLLLLPCIDLTS